MQEVQETRVWSLVGKILWSRKWQPIPVLLPGKFHRRRSLVGYSPWCCQKLDMTEHMPQLIFVYMGVLIFSSVQLYYMFCSFIYHHSEERRRQWHPTQYSCLENPMDGGAWWAAVHGVAKSRTRLSDFTFMHWRRKWQPTPVFLPGESQGRGSLVGLPSVGSHRVGHDWSDLAAT